MLTRMVAADSRVPQNRRTYRATEMQTGQRLSEAISSLKALRELQITRLKLDLASISRLSPLERFAIFSDHRWEEVERLLECFPSLIYIAVKVCDWHGKEDRMREVITSGSMIRTRKRFPALIIHIVGILPFVSHVASPSSCTGRF